MGDVQPTSENKGIPVKVQWDLYGKADRILIKSKIVVTSNLHDGDPGYVFRLISYMKPPTGDYELVVKLLQEVPEITNPRTKIIMKLVSGIDAPSTSERKMIQWISILMIEPLIWIIEALLTLVLLYKILRNR